MSEWPVHLMHTQYWRGRTNSCIGHRVRQLGRRGWLGAKCGLGFGHGLPGADPCALPLSRVHCHDTNDQIFMCMLLCFTSRCVSIVG